MTLTKNTDDFDFVLATPRGVDEFITPEDITESVRLLAKLLANLIDPKAMDGVIGPSDIVLAFIETWVAEMKTKGRTIKIHERKFSSQVSFATLATLPPPSPAHAGLSFTLAHTEEEAVAVVPLVVDFSTEWRKATTLPEIQRMMSAGAQLRLLWIYRVEGEIAGYSLVGRMTPRTVAIRHVYVSPAFRRRGIAGAMVRALTRFYLGAEPLGFDGAPSPKPAAGVRAEVCLNVSREEVAQLYKRCGFLLGEGDRDPTTGQIGSFRSLFISVEVM